MDPNNVSSSSSTTTSTWGITISENIKFKGKGATLASLLLAMSALVVIAIMYKCIRARQNDAEVDLQADVQLAARS
ncbi:hypothetical protein DITRI_Ditri15bG0118200 [Diplodiscus trichospermus]